MTREQEKQRSIERKESRNMKHFEVYEQFRTQQKEQADYTRQALASYRKEGR